MKEQKLVAPEMVDEIIALYDLGVDEREIKYLISLKRQKLVED